MNAALRKRISVSGARHRRQRGFALLEILVAFVILALGLAAVLTGISVAMGSDAKTHANRSMLRVAQSRLEAAGVTGALVPGHQEGRVGNYIWRQAVTAVQPGAGSRKPDGSRPESAGGSTVSMFWVEVAVSAGDGTVARLAGLKLGPAARP